MLEQRKLLRALTAAQRGSSISLGSSRSQRLKGVTPCPGHTALGFDHAGIARHGQASC